MNTNGLVRFIVVGMVLLLVISVGMYFLFKPSTTSPPNEADINAIYQVVGEFGARLKDVGLSDSKQNIITAVDFNLKRLITNRLYQEFVQDTSKVPGRTVSSPWPERIEIDSVQKLDGTSYTVNGKIIGMTSVEMTHGGNAGETPITLTLKRVNGTWLIDNVT
jgi:hypothetical protein